MKAEELFLAIGEVESSRLTRSERRRQDPPVKGNRRNPK